MLTIEDFVQDMAARAIEAAEFKLEAYGVGSHGYCTQVIHAEVPGVLWLRDQLTSAREETHRALDLLRDLRDHSKAFEEAQAAARTAQVSMSQASYDEYTSDEQYGLLMAKRDATHATQQLAWRRLIDAHNRADALLAEYPGGEQK